ncbi:hypothetical protein CCAE64S_01527 [Castellaniella caeni]
MNRRRLMRAVIIHDQMDIEVLRHALFDGMQKAQEFGCTVTLLGLANDLAGDQYRAI